jgi:hypothetical protein
MPLVGSTYPALADLMVILPGLAGISLAANPNGAISQAVERTAAARRRREERRAAPHDRGPLLGLLLPPPPELVPERLVVGGSPGGAEVAAIDAEVGLSWGRCDADPRRT